MQSDLHPTYVTDAKIVCATCGSVLTTGSTMPSMRVEVCSNCHPFYTGRQNLVDTAGRVDRFKRIMTRRDATRAARSSTKKSKVSARKS